MAISDILNRRVRARPAEDDDVYSEQSDVAEEVSQDEGEEGESDADADADADDLQSQDVRYLPAS
jgi:ribosomal RNA-processing protein 36